MNQYINDVIHLTRMEFLIKYWPVYVVMFGLFLILDILHFKHKKKHKSEPKNPFEKVNK